MPVLNTYVAGHILKGMYRNDTFHDVQSTDRSYSLLNILPPVDNSDPLYKKYVTAHNEVRGQRDVNQQKKRFAESFLKGRISTMEHLCSCIANDDMLTRYRFVFNNTAEQDLPLQTHLLRQIITVLTNSDAKKWYRQLNPARCAHLPFAMLTMCHTVKQKFRALSLNTELLKKFKAGTMSDQPYLDIISHVQLQLNKLHDCIESTKLGDWTTPDQAYDNLFSDHALSISEYNENLARMHPSPTKRSRLSADKTPTVQDLQEKILSLQQSLARPPQQDKFQGDGIGFLEGNDKVPVFQTVPEFCHNHSKVNRSCRNPRCTRRHVKWDEFTDAQKVEIASIVQPMTGLSFANGIVVPPGAGNNPVRVDNNNPPQPTSSQYGPPRGGWGSGGGGGWNRYSRRN